MSVDSTVAPKHPSWSSSKFWCIDPSNMAARSSVYFEISRAYCTSCFKNRFFSSVIMLCFIIRPDLEAAKQPEWIQSHRRPGCFASWWIWIPIQCWVRYRQWAWIHQRYILILPCYFYDWICQLNVTGSDLFSISNCFILHFLKLSFLVYQLFD